MDATKKELTIKLSDYTTLNWDRMSGKWRAVLSQEIPGSGTVDVVELNEDELFVLFSIILSEMEGTWKD